MSTTNRKSNVAPKMEEGWCEIQNFFLKFQSVAADDAMEMLPPILPHPSQMWNEHKLVERAEISKYTANRRTWTLRKIEVNIVVVTLHLVSG